MARLTLPILPALSSPLCGHRHFEPGFTGLAAKLISTTYRPVEVFVAAGAIYLLLNLIFSRMFKLVEYRLSAAQRQPLIEPGAGEKA